MVLLTEISSSSSTHHNYQYDVFLSFRGLDTRLGFISHLYEALLDANLKTFFDDEEIETGQPLKPELETAIKSSRASIIVLSKNYASSTWCLDELVLILKQQNHIVIPIFYHVEPTNVRKQQSSFGKAMEVHKKRMKKETDAEKRNQWAEKIELWKKALKQVADLKGKDANGRKETELIEEVTTDILRRLPVTLNNTLPPLTGRFYDISFITSWLTDGSCHTADILTIVGMGGIGKTSLAKYVFQSHSNKFHKSSFIEGIDAKCNEHFNGLLDLQQKLYGAISKINPLQVNDIDVVYASKIENALARNRVFIVLDDIGSPGQLDALLGNKCLHPGSKIIITTKDASLTESCALFNPKVQPKHVKVLINGLDEDASLKLLCIHAFKSQKPKDGYAGVSEKLVKYCQGHPLALKLLGRSLHNAEVACWEDCIKELKKEPHSHINMALKRSFDSLPFKTDKDLFKHIACFFVGMNRGVVETILNACDINTKFGITILIDRCLLSIGSYNELMMHQLIQELGRDLVRQESRDKPWERSRLWCHEESLKVLKQKNGTKNVLGLTLDMRVLEKEQLSGSLQLKADALSMMDNLKLLQLNYVEMIGSFKDISKELRWLCMNGFQLKSIPSDLPMENLVVLDMSHSSIQSFDMSYSSSQRIWNRLKGLSGSRSNEKRLLGSLKILVLSFCEQLRSIGGFYELPVLERLIISNCTSLIELCESIKHCVQLVFIDLSNCKKLKKLPKTISMLKKVKTIVSNGCDLSVFPIETRDMDSLQMIEANNIAINSQTSSSASVEVIPIDLRSFVSCLPISLVRLSLRKSNLSNKSFPMDFSGLSMLEELCLDGNPIVSMPRCVRTLPRLQKLTMDGCELLETVEHPPSSLRQLDCEFSDKLREMKFNPEMSPLTLNLDTPEDRALVVEGVIEVQELADVKDEVLCSLGWANFELIKYQHLTTYRGLRKPTRRAIKMCFEYGIFSTFYEGKEMPNWISCRSKGSSLSFTIPSSPNKLLSGLNFCCILEKLSPSSSDKRYALPIIKIRNLTKKRTWSYFHYYIYRMVEAKEGLIFLSHWMFGKNDMEDGDQLSISLEIWDNQVTIVRECGVGLVCVDGRIKEDVLGYYKSWNHIIGGDLSIFQRPTGEYMLHHIILNENFRAFSNQKSDLVLHPRKNRSSVLETMKFRTAALKTERLKTESLRTKIAIMELIFDMSKC